MTDSTHHNNKRIAKNTLFLYIRMLFLMFISFFTSRMLLKELGVVDYGIYNVVGSVVAVFSSLQSLLASSTQRFLNVAHGKGDKAQLNKIFSMSVLIHLAISAFFLLVILPVGFFIINTYLVIPQDRIVAANWVYLFSVLSAIVIVMTVPYNAVIIANERMSVFAYISILEGLLKLAVIFLLIYSVFDQLITYAVLLFIAGLIVRIVNMVYCKRKFEECKKINLCWDKSLFKELGSFAGWQFLGNTGWSLQSQGLNMMLNAFFGPVLNAASGIANQVNGALSLFVNNMMLAINPQLTKVAAQEDKESFETLFFRASRFSFLLFSVLAFPVFLLTKPILSFWLTVIPEYTISFIHWILIYSLIRSLHMSIDSALKAIGKIKIYQISDFICMVLSLPLVFVIYKQGGLPDSIFIVMILMQILATSISAILLTIYSSLSLKSYFIKVLLRCLMCWGVFVAFLFFANQSSITTKCISVVVFWLMSPAFILTKLEFSSIIKFIKIKLS